MRPFTAAFAVALLTGCSAVDYEPVQERPLSQIAAEGCGEPGARVLVTAQVSKAYEDTVVLWDGLDPRRTLAVTVPGPSLLERVRDWFGENKNEVMRRQLNQLASQRQPVTAMLECKGGGVAPELVNVTFTNSQGQQVAIPY